LLVRFELPLQGDEQLLTRTHPMVENIASYVLETVLDNPAESIASRCGVVRTDAVQKRTTLLLLRLRYHLHTRFSRGDTTYLLAEECITVGFEGAPDNPTWLDAVDNLYQAMPSENITDDQKRGFLERVLDAYPDLTPHLNQIAEERAQALLEAHTRVRLNKTISYDVQPQLPIDIIGIYIYLPSKQGGF
ncbi:MAG: ATP-dependent helicase, partial [Anaerolineae bacterium]|nr:ATP-dependent helicase [Anaerolineae bacterium]